MIKDYVQLDAASLVQKEDRGTQRYIIGWCSPPNFGCRLVYVAPGLVNGKYAVELVPTEKNGSNILYRVCGPEFQILYGESEIELDEGSC